MAANVPILFLLVVLNGFVEGQKYLLGEADIGEYYSSQEDYTDRPLHYYQSTSLYPGEYYLAKDLQTSELPAHLQDSLPQYQPRITSQQFQSNDPAPFRLSKEYIKPSTHRPDYSRILPNRINHEHLKPQISLDNNAPNNLLELPNYGKELKDNEFDSPKKAHASQLLTNEKSNNNINPLNADKNEQGNQIDSHFNKRDSIEEVQKELNYQEDYEVPDQDNINSDNNDYEDSREKNNNKLGESEYDEEEYDEEDDDEDEEYEENQPEISEEKNKQLTNESFEILTMKPQQVNGENKFESFIDVESMDTTTQEPATSNILTEPPVLVNNIDNNRKDKPEIVVSVVTSKTIVNNTIISPVVISTTTEFMKLPEENSTDSWIVVASVQTSRSISGARYIPSSVVDQDERIQLLNDPKPVTEPISQNHEHLQLETSISSIAPSITTKFKTSTESLIDKLDRVQSDLSSSLLTGGYKNDNIAVIEENPSTKIETTTEHITNAPSVENVSTKAPYPQVNIRKFNAGNRPFKAKSKATDSRTKQIPASTPKAQFKQNDPAASLLNKAKPLDDISALLPPGYKASQLETSSENSVLSSILSKVKPVDDISVLLPPGYKQSASGEKEKARPLEDISSLVPPGYKPSQKSTSNIFANVKHVDINALLPPGYNPSTTEKSLSNILGKAKPIDDISALLPPGYKISQSTEKPTNNIFNKAKPIDDISALLPPGFKTSQSESTDKSTSNLLAKAKPVDDISALLPPGYRKGFSKPKVTTASSVSLETVSHSIPANLLPPGYSNANNRTSESSQTATPPGISTSSTQISTPTGGIKLVFPSRPGGGSRKSPRLTTPRTQNEDNNKPTLPTIQKGWPVRASTEFTGWPTPSTTPISIEKLLEAARAAYTSTSSETPMETVSTTTTTTTTTTTVKPTTPGICINDCDLAATIKLIGGTKWVPELLDRNTKEYQILANSVQSELENIYNSSPVLKEWYRKIRIDGFSEGSVLVDYLVEFNDIGKKLNTQEIKRLFHETLTELNGLPNREGKSINGSKVDRYTLGEFEVDPKYTDFVVIPLQNYPTVGYAEDMLMPQWAIAVIVIGLASLLFVIIFGVTVLFNRHKNSKKTPEPLTEDMLNELNKNHMGGLENYAVDDFYNMDDVWSDKHYDQKPQKKRPANGSVYDNSTANLYDSWRSQWNGEPWSAYNNSQYGHPSSQRSGHSGYRRPQYDTNF